jgi:GPH family glycoside/pentoside/hexuronide:cation symporter
MIGNYLLYFFQPTVKSGIPSLLPQNKLLGFITVMALLTGIGKVIDAITDPLVASLSDKCTHKDGRRMPFLKYAAIPYAVSVLMIFMAPFKAGSVANAIWVGFFLIAYYTAYTFFFIPRNALVPEVIPDAKDRVGYYGISTAFFMGSSSFMYAATLFVNLIKGLGVSALGSWRIVFTVFAVIGLVFTFLFRLITRRKSSN